MDLTKIKGFGTKSLANLKERLQEQGFVLPQSGGMIVTPLQVLEDTLERELQELRALEATEDVTAAAVMEKLVSEPAPVAAVLTEEPAPEPAPAAPVVTEERVPEPALAVPAVVEERAPEPAPVPKPVPAWQTAAAPPAAEAPPAAPPGQQMRCTICQQDVGVTEFGAHIQAHAQAAG